MSDSESSKYSDSSSDSDTESEPERYYKRAVIIMLKLEKNLVKNILLQKN